MSTLALEGIALWRRPVTRRRWVLTLAALLVAAPLHAATYYVATSGNDNTSCTAARTISTPRQTIGNGIRCLSAGDILYVRAGTYPEAIQLFGWPGGSQGTSWATAITISAYPGESVKIKPPAGSDFVLVMRGSGAGAVDAPRYLIFNGLTFDGSNGMNYEIVKLTAWDPTINPADAPAHHIRISNSRVTSVLGSGSGGGSGSGILITWGSEYIEVLNTEVDHVGRAGPPSGQCIYGAANHLLLDGVAAHHCAGFGISNINSNAGLDASDHVVKNSSIHDNGQLNPSQGGGLNEGEGSGHRLYNNLVYNNLGHGIVLAFNPGPGAIGTLIENNTVYGNAGTGIFISAAQFGTFVRNNISYLNANGNYANSGAATIADHNSMDGTNPQFVAAESGDFHLQATSPLIDTGAALSTVTNDFSGTIRPQGASYDIGAYERAQGTSTPTPTPTNLHIVNP